MKRLLINLISDDQHRIKFIRDSGGRFSIGNCQKKSSQSPCYFSGW